MEAIVLDLPSIASESELSRPVAEALALAASVVLGRLHGPGSRDDAEIHGGAETRTAEVRRVAVDAVARDTYADPQEATEEGAEGIAICVARRVLDRVVFRRLPKGTGADCLMREIQSTDDDLYERLECSGIGDGEESAAARLHSKLDQLGRFQAHVAGHAVVTNFRTNPVEVRHGSFHS